ncbi:MAG: hypothetical protein KA715_09075 [Xanthomonadaceae bacterium]|nr:hypothetical protein [Xanthomonadaceae bacterium]
MSSSFANQILAQIELFSQTDKYQLLASSALPG